MQRFIGTKIILATAMTLGAYNEKRGWPMPADEDPNAEGYLVEYTDGGKPNHPDHKGYISWSPKAQFENAYRRTDGLTFGQAIEALKLGKRVAREGWNGKGMFLWLNKGSIANGPKCSPIEGIGADLFDHGDTGTVTRLPNINMRAATGSTVTGWLASQTDVLSDDWKILEEVEPSHMSAADGD